METICIYIYIYRNTSSSTTLHSSGKKLVNEQGQQHQLQQTQLKHTVSPALSGHTSSGLTASIRQQEGLLSSSSSSSHVDTASGEEGGGGRSVEDDIMMKNNNNNNNNNDMNVIHVYVPEQPKVGITEINISSNTTVVELLQLLAQKHRLQIHTYICMYVYICTF